MGGSFLLVFFLNSILFTIIFWLLTVFCESYFNKKNSKNRKKFYECGFKSISDFSITINIKFSMVAIFLLLYDIEFIFLVPFLFNYLYANFIIFFIFLFFITLIILSLVFDIFYNSFDLSI